MYCKPTRITHKHVSIISLKTLCYIVENYTFTFLPAVCGRKEKSSTPSGVMTDSCGWSREP